MILRTLFLSALAWHFFLPTVGATTFYLDPINGSMANTGSANSPWGSLESVIAQGLIESFRYSPLPYDPVGSSLIPKNANAPVKAGDTLMLRSGLHGDIFLQNYNNPAPIFVMAEPGHTPILKTLKLQASSKWHFEGLEISSEPYGTYIAGSLVFIETHNWQGPSSHIEIRDCSVYSAAVPWADSSSWITKASNGIYLREADSVRIINNRVSNVDMGILCWGDYCEVIGNEVANFSGDGMRILGSYGLYEGNTIKNCYDVDDNHDDGIQSYTTNGLVVDYNIVRGNTIINYEDPNQPLVGPLQGIGCFDGFYNNWIVENNLIVVNHWHGITFLGANNCLIRNNTVLDPTPNITPGASWIRIDDHKNGQPSTGCVVKNNVANQFVVDGALSNNQVLSNYAAYQANFLDYANTDFHLLPGSVLIDAAETSSAPSVDLDGTIRPQGPDADIGCYEWVDALGTAEGGIKDAGIQIYPNPGPGLLQLAFDKKQSLVRLTVVTSNGQRLKTMTYRETERAELDLSQLPEGLYFLHIILPDSGVRAVRSLVLER
jgi:parallel beta-helix repeat protein